jgi:hypothetical protein
MGEDVMEVEVHPLEWVIEKLKVEVEKAGSCGAFAKRIGVSPAYIIAVRSGKTPPGPAITSFFGLTTVKMYEVRK